MPFSYLGVNEFTGNPKGEVATLTAYSGSIMGPNGGIVRAPLPSDNNTQKLTHLTRALAPRALGVDAEDDEIAPRWGDVFELEEEI
jgi:hypothetical protein